jgi:hypothetical protein
MFQGSDIMSGGTFWIVILVLALFLGAVMTAAYNEDKTEGL